MNRQRTRKILCLMLASWMAASTVATEPRHTAAAQPANAKQQVLDLEREWVAAENKHDAAVLERILDDKFLASFGANQPRDKTTFIQHITSGDIDPTESQTLTDQIVIIDRDTAVVVGADTVRGTQNGSAYTTVYRYTVTYIHRDGRWLALAEHLVAVPNAK